MLNHQALLDFDSAAREMLSLLRRRLKFDLWMITRVEQVDWIILYTEGDKYGLHEGDTLRWTDSFCYRMVTQNAPRMAPNCRSVPAYIEAPVGRQLTIGAYIGIPIRYSDGRLFGTLCAIHPEAFPDSIAEELPLLELLTKMLEMVLTVCLDTTGRARHLAYQSAEPLRDDLTGLYNRQAWDQLLAGEEKRCQIYGHSACVVSIHLDNVEQVYRDLGLAEGERYLVRLAEIIQTTARKQDIVARLDADKFAILAVESGRAEGEKLLERLRLYLKLAQLDASLAIAARRSCQYRLAEVWQEADEAVKLR